MSLLQVRGGIPNVRRIAVTAVGQKVNLPSYTIFLKIRAEDFPCRLFFTEADFDGDKNYILAPMPSTSRPYGEWDGPVEAENVWVKGDGGTSNVELVTFQRRG